MRKTKKIQLLKMIMAVLGAYIGLGVSFSCASEYISTLGNDSAYTFKATDVSANNTVTVYDYNKEKGIVEAINYELGIKNTTLGSGEAELSRAFSVNILKDYDVEFVAKYSASRLSPKVAVKTSGNDIDRDFVDLMIAGSNKSWADGGTAIAEWSAGSKKLESLDGMFINNHVVSSKNMQAWGGAVLYSGSADSIAGDYIGNYTSSEVEASGGAVNLLKKTVKTVAGNFVGNYTINTAKNDQGASGAYGGAFYSVNGSVINNLVGKFIGNYAYSLNSTLVANGGAIYVAYKSKIDNITADFIGNYALANGSAVGGAIAITDTIGKITGDFIGNYAQSFANIGKGGGIADSYNANVVNIPRIGSIKGNFISNYVNAYDDAIGGAIFNSCLNIDEIEGDFLSNSVKSTNANAYGGALYSEIGNTKFMNTNFIGNYAISDVGEAKGGAVYTSKDLSFVADNKDMVVAGNYTISNGVKDDNAFYVNSADATLDFELKNDAEFILKDNIDGLVGYNVNIKGDNKNTLYLHNDIRNADVSFDNVNIDGVDGKAQIFNFNSLQLGSSMDFVADIDFEKETMDSFRANNTYTLIDGVKLNVSELNWINEPVKDKTSILFAEEGLKENVTYSGISKIVTPVYVYNIAYENKEDAGYFVVSRGSGMSGLSGYNPTAVTSSVSSTVGAVSTLNQALSYSFQNSDNYMSLSSVGRVLHKYNDEKSNISMNSGDFSPLYTKYGKGNVWIKPYALFEDVNLKNGTKVSNNVYGTLVGYDTGVREINDEWDGAITGYIGYSGATQKYGGIKSKQKGGVVGGTLTLYKGDLFNAITMSLGALDSEDETLYGEDSYTVLLGGVGNKIGYNFEFENGKFIIQPSLLLSYTAVNAFDYTNVLGAKVKNDQVNSFQFSPGVKFIANLASGWQPYASISRYWNLDGKSDSTVNGVRIPQMSIKPYWEYGLGVQRSVKDNFMAYGQSMFESGGRKGVALTAGIRWSFDYK